MHATAPDLEGELALLLAGTAASRERYRERVRELATAVDGRRLEATLLRQGMLGLLGTRLVESAPGALPAGFAASAAEHTARARRQGVSQQMITVRLLAALEEAGIRALPLKGPLLGERLYGDIGARVSADIDLLVAEHDLVSAVEVVLALGYRRLLPRAPSDTTRPLLHEQLVHPSGLPAVELHWRVHWYEQGFSSRVLARSALTPGGWLAPQPDDELALLLLLYGRDGFAGLRLACDLAAWWDRYGAALGPLGVSDAVRAHPAMTRVVATAALLTDQLAGVPAAQVLSAELLAQASRRALRLSNWSLRGSEGQIDANVSLVDWLLAPAGQWRALTRRHLLLARRDILTRWPGSGTSARQLASLRAGHALRVVRRYAIACWSVLRRGTWAPFPASLRAPHA